MLGWELLHKFRLLRLGSFGVAVGHHVWNDTVHLLQLDQYPEQQNRVLEVLKVVQRRLLVDLGAHLHDLGGVR